MAFTYTAFDYEIPRFACAGDVFREVFYKVDEFQSTFDGQ